MLLHASWVKLRCWFMQWDPVVARLHYCVLCPKRITLRIFLLSRVLLRFGSEITTGWLQLVKLLSRLWSFLVSEAWLADKGLWVDLWKLSLTLAPPRFPLFLALLKEVNLFSMIPSMTWNLSGIRSQNKYFCPQVLCVRCFSQWREMYLKCMPARIES